MPYRYNGKRVTSIWVDEDLLYSAAVMAEELGYSSLSEFVRDLIAEAVGTYEIVKHMKVSKHSKRKLVKSGLLAKLRSVF